MDEIVEIDFSEFQKELPKTKYRKSYYGNIEEYDMNGEYLRTWSSSTEIADYYGITKTSILHCCI